MSSSHSNKSPSSSRRKHHFPWHSHHSTTSSRRQDTRLLQQSLHLHSLHVDDLADLHGAWDVSAHEEDDYDSLLDESVIDDDFFLDEIKDIKPQPFRSLKPQEEGLVNHGVSPRNPGRGLDSTERSRGETTKQSQTGEGWQVINSLFSYLDETGTGTLETHELLNALECIGDMDLMEVIVKVTDSTKVIDKKQLHDLLFARRERTSNQRVALFVLTWILPLFYSATTRLPFISVALEITVARSGTLAQAGIILGSYQISRALANAIVRRFGGDDPLKRLQFPMVLAGLIGWLFSGLAVEMGGAWSLLALCCVGLSEVVVNLQTGLVLESQLESPAHVADPGILSDRLRSQYVAISTGSFVAYVAGGSLYTYFGFGAVCWLGVACQVVQLIGTAVFRYGSLSRGKEPEDRLGLDGRQLLRSITYRINAMLVIVQEARDTSTNLNFEEPGIAEASKLARNDSVLIDSLKRLYHAFFHDKEQQRESRRHRESRKSTVMALPLEKLMANTKSLSINQSEHPDSSDLKDIDFAKVAMRLMDMNGDGDVSEKEFVSYLAPRVYLSLFGSFRLNAVNVVWPYLKFVVLTQAIMALCIGTFLSTALLMYTEHFETSASTVGLLLGVGEGLGALVIFAANAISKRNSSRRTKEHDGQQGGLLMTLMTRPLHVPVVLLALGIATAGFSSTVFAVAITFQMTMSALNDLGVTVLNELTASSIPADKFKSYQGLGQWLRRVGNMLTGILGPVLFSISPELPFILFGGLVIVWSFILWFLLYCHACNIRTDKDKASKKRPIPGPIDVFRECVNTPWHILEREHYASNRDKIDEKLAPTNAVVDVEVIEYRVRRIGAALRAEAAKRQELESQLQQALQQEVTRRTELEERLALIKKPKSITKKLVAFGETSLDHLDELRMSASLAEEPLQHPVSLRKSSSAGLPQRSKYKL